MFGLAGAFGGQVKAMVFTAQINLCYFSIFDETMCYLKCTYLYVMSQFHRHGPSSAHALSKPADIQHVFVLHLSESLLLQPVPEFLRCVSLRHDVSHVTAANARQTADMHH